MCTLCGEKMYILLDCLHLREWELILRNINDFVQIARVNGIKFEVYTNEQSSHHKAHLHVSTASASMSIAIDNGEILAFSGKISPAQKKMAQDWLDNNRSFVIEKWNQISNGIEISVA